MNIEVKIDDQDYAFEAEGEFSWGADELLFDADRDVLTHTQIGQPGYGVFSVLDAIGHRSFCEATRALLLTILDDVGIRHQDLRLEDYHLLVTDAEHQRVIERTRELRFSDLNLDIAAIARTLSTKLGIELDPFVRALGRDHIQLRINRPRSLDINPPHRDGYLPIWKNVLNLWMPICGCDGNSSLPVIAGSHLLNEKDVYRTPAHGASIKGNAYRVPAIARTRPGLVMTRPNPREGEVIAFTPFLIHGAAVNMNADETRMALEFRLQIKDQAYE